MPHGVPAVAVKDLRFDQRYRFTRHAGTLVHRVNRRTQEFSQHRSGPTLHANACLLDCSMHCRIVRYVYQGAAQARRDRAGSAPRSRPSACRARRPAAPPVSATVSRLGWPSPPGGDRPRRPGWCQGRCAPRCGDLRPPLTPSGTSWVSRRCGDGRRPRLHEVGYRPARFILRAFGPPGSRRLIAVAQQPTAVMHLRSRHRTAL
jgi:hypothetical protein